MYTCINAYLHFLTVNLGFAEVSSPEEWIERGEIFMKKSFFNTAATCFREAGEFEMEKFAKCHQKAFDASKYVQKINFSDSKVNEIF